MELVWYGQACFHLKGKNVTLLTDPFDPQFTGLRLPKDLRADIVLVTHAHGDHNFVQGVAGQPLVILGPGEYDTKGVSVVGVSSYHDKKQGAERGKNTIYQILLDNISLVHLGDLGHLLTQEQLEQIGETDILLIPVGGVYTINAKEAAEVVAQLEPKIIIPMHYALPDLKFPLEPVAQFLEEMGVEEGEPRSKLVISKDKLPEEPEVVVLSKQ